MRTCSQGNGSVYVVMLIGIHAHAHAHAQLSSNGLILQWFRAVIGGNWNILEMKPCQIKAAK